MLDYDPDIDYAPDVDPEEKPRIAPAVYQHYVDVRRSDQHHPLALIAGTIGAAIGVAIWLGISMTANVEAEWTAVGVGLCTGGLVRWAGKGFDRIFGVLGALLTGIGCFAGTLLSGCHFSALKTEGATFMDAVSTLTPTMTREMFNATFDPVDGVFFGIAVIVAFRISYRRMNAVERATLITHSEGGGFGADSQAA
ncbi:MAG: hypothetical protein ACYSU7_10580 [Planctomycetota bacterium]|jgi:hypothetical protein